ncbi:Probable tRNA-dihydrouridine synthase [uncultured Clostridium sp.]|nr:Probable tRNA-dihydrouridine synthase [uncultured Clostridium sp.]
MSQPPLFEGNAMEYYFAPMEGITGGEFRRVHHRHFFGVDKYYMPFISPTREHLFTQRERRNIDPEVNRGIPAVPQLLTKSAEDFLWAANALGEMGYEEVNLNLGCPSGTVVAKGKGAGMLAHPEELDRFLDQVFGGVRVKVSVKTRLGLGSPEEFGPLLEIFEKYPLHLLIIHPRVRKDFYSEPVRIEAFSRALEMYSGPVCYNGGLVTAEGCCRFQERFPQVDRVMIGQGLLADPALAAKAKGEPPPDRKVLRAFHDGLYQTYLEAFGSQRNTVFHMKELWSYLCRLFEGGDRLFKDIRKAQDSRDYEGAVARVFGELPMRKDALWE